MISRAFVIIVELVELSVCVDRMVYSLDRSSTYSGLCTGEMRARPTPIHVSSRTGGPTESCVFPVHYASWWTHKINFG